MKAKKKIFLSAEYKEEHQRKMIKSLERANFELVNSTNFEEINTTICSVHYLGNSENNEESKTKALIDFQKVNDFTKENSNYKSFFWNPKTNMRDDQENELADKIQRELQNNMILSNVPYAIQFVEDILTVINEQPVKKYDTTPADIFLICSEADQQEASQIQLLLSDIVKLVKLVIIQETGDDYEEMAAQQMTVCKLAVIYYKKGKNWAVPFAQQLWKKVGGAGSGTPICLIGDAETNSENDAQFSAPKVTPLLLPIELIPLEVKVQYDIATESNV